MLFCDKKEFKYDNSMAKLLIPEIIKNSKTIIPFNIIEIGNKEICFTNNSKIIWDKNSLILTNFIYDFNLLNYSFSTNDTCHINEWYDRIHLGEINKKNYPFTIGKTIRISKKEFSSSSKFIKFKKLNELNLQFIPEKCRSEHTKTIKLMDAFISREYDSNDEKFVSSTNMIISAFNVCIHNKTVPGKDKNLFQSYNITSNKKFGCDLNEIFSEINNFEIVDKFT